MHNPFWGSRETTPPSPCNTVISWASPRPTLYNTVIISPYPPVREFLIFARPPVNLKIWWKMTKDLTATQQKSNGSVFFFFSFCAWFAYFFLCFWAYNLCSSVKPCNICKQIPVFLPASGIRTLAATCPLFWIHLVALFTLCLRLFPCLNCSLNGK